MKWWKRLIFSISSLVWGYVSLDYLYFAFLQLTGFGQTGNVYQPEKEVPKQLLGAGLFIIWFVILAVYICLIRHFSVQIDLVESDRRTGEEKIRRKWFDIILQSGLIITGGILRLCYLLFVYLPKA